MKNNSAPSRMLLMADGGQPRRCSADRSTLWLLASLPLVIAGGLFFSLVLQSAGVLVEFDSGVDGIRDTLLFLLLVCLSGLTAAIEIDLRLKRMGGPESDSARGLLGCASLLAFVLFLVWVADAMARSTTHEAGIEFLLCVLILGICGPLLWSAASRLARKEYRLALLGGFVIATAALELAFDENAPDAEERLFLYQSVLVALAVAFRLSVWGLKDFHRPPASRREP